MASQSERFDMDFNIEKNSPGIINISWGFPLTSFTGFEERTFEIDPKDAPSSYVVYCVLCVPSTSPVSWEPQQLEVQYILRRTESTSNHVNGNEKHKHELVPRLIKGSLNYGEYVLFYQTSPGQWSTGWFQATFTRPSRTTPASWWVWHNRADIWMEFDVNEEEPSQNVSVASEEKDNSFEKIDVSKESRRENHFVAQFTDLFKNQLNCDTYFIFPGGKRIGAHQSILMARSPVFASFYKPSSKNGAGKTDIRIDDIDVSVFSILLEFAYSGKLTEPLTDDFAKSLFAAADKYEMDDLKDECIDFLASHITEDKALNLMVWSELVADKRMQEAVTKFCCVQRRNICRLQQWENFVVNYPKLCAMLTRRMIEESSRET